MLLKICLLILVLTFHYFAEQMAPQIRPGIDGLKGHKTHPVADAGYCDKSFNFKYLIIGQEVLRIGTIQHATT